MRRLGLSRLASLKLRSVRGYERRSPGELLHFDIKRLGRIHGISRRIAGSRTNSRNCGIGWDAIGQRTRTIMVHALTPNTAPPP